MTESHRDASIHSERNNGQKTLQEVIRCPPGLRRKFRQFRTFAQFLVTRRRFLRGIHRIFVPRRYFFLLWAFAITLFVYFKWYFPLHAMKTIKRSGLLAFRKDWCRVRRVVTDWELLGTTCEGSTKFGVDLPGWGIHNRTDPMKSFISFMDVKPAGEFSRFSIQSQSYNSQPKTIGGDDWRVLIWGPSVLAPTVIDHGNGTYEVLFLILEPGTYFASIVLDYSLCEGMRNPPDYWFMFGNIHGNSQPEGSLVERYVFIRTPLWEGIPLTITVPSQAGPTRYDEFLSYGLGNPPSCGENCKFLWDGFGRWSNGTWRPHVKGLWRKRSLRNREGVLWFYGDSNTGRFYRSIRRTRLCKTVFRVCSLSYNWVYPIKNASAEKHQRNFLPINITRVLEAIAKVIYLPEMKDEKSVIILNHGLHFITSTNFTTYREVIDGIVDLFRETKVNDDGRIELKFKGKMIWKTNAAIHRERLRYPHIHKRRFLTRQRVQLYNAYATWAMCKAGIEVLDVYPLSASFPNGTDNSVDPYDMVHYKDLVFKPAEEILLEYFKPSLPRSNTESDRHYTK